MFNNVLLSIYNEKYLLKYIVHSSIIYIPIYKRFIKNLLAKSQYVVVTLKIRTYDDNIIVVIYNILCNIHRKWLKLNHIPTPKCPEII